RGRVLLEQPPGARGTVHQLAAAVWASVVERLGARRTTGAFEAADEVARRMRWQIGASSLAVRTQLQAHTAGLSASQMLSTIRSIAPAWSPSAMTRILGSVPDFRITSRPRPASAASPSAIAALTRASASGSPPE